MTLKYESPWDACEQTGNSAPYYQQFESAKLEVGGVYLSAKGTWQERTYQIFYIGEGVALGKELATRELTLSHKIKMFHSEGFREGWVYGDDRSLYRLQNKD